MPNPYESLYTDPIAPIIPAAGQKPRKVRWWVYALLSLLVMATVAAGALLVVKMIFDMNQPTDVAAVAPTVTPEPTSTAPAPTRQTEVSRVVEVTPTAAPTDAPKEEVSPINLVWVKEGLGANLRADPAGQVLAVVPNGTRVEIQDTKEVSGTNWVKISSGIYAGWMAKGLVFVVSGDSAVYHVVNEGAYVREKAWGAVLDTLQSGTPIIVTGEAVADTDTFEGAVKLNWTPVRLLDGRTGWIASHLIEK